MSTPSLGSILAKAIIKENARLEAENNARSLKLEIERQRMLNETRKLFEAFKHDIRQDILDGHTKIALELSDARCSCLEIDDWDDYPITDPSHPANTIWKQFSMWAKENALSPSIVRTEDGAENGWVLSIAPKSELLFVCEPTPVTKVFALADAQSIYSGIKHLELEAPTLRTRCR